MTRRERIAAWMFVLVLLPFGVVWLFASEYRKALEMWAERS